MADLNTGMGKRSTRSTSGTADWLCASELFWSNSGSRKRRVLCLYTSPWVSFAISTYTVSCSYVILFTTGPMQKLWPFFVMYARPWLLTVVFLSVCVAFSQFPCSIIKLCGTDDFVVGNLDRSSDAATKGMGIDVVCAPQSRSTRLSTDSWILGPWTDAAWHRGRKYLHVPTWFAHANG